MSSLFSILAGALLSGLVCAACSGSDSSNSKDEQGGAENRPGSSGGGSSSSEGGASSAPTTDAEVYGDVVSGQYHLGPVDFSETEWHNACAPGGGYRQQLREATGLGGEYLAGLANEHADAGGTCDACILIKAANGRQIVARVVTYGVEAEPGDIDVSPSVYAALNTDEYPRTMTWQFAKCPDTGTLRYEFQTEANVWWTSLWVRNQRVPVTKVEVQSANHSSYFALRRETDGTLNDDGGFGEGQFTLRLTAMDGQVITETFASFDPGELVTSTQQFQ